MRQAAQTFAPVGPTPSAARVRKSHLFVKRQTPNLDRLPLRAEVSLEFATASSYEP